MWPGLEIEPEAAVVEETVPFGKSMGLGMDEDDINQLIKDHSEELTTEELKELQTHKHTEVLQEIDNAEKVVSTSEIKENLGIWEKKLQQGLRHLPDSLQKTFSKGE